MRVLSALAVGVGIVGCGSVLSEGFDGIRSDRPFAEIEASDGVSFPAYLEAEFVPAEGSEPDMLVFWDWASGRWAGEMLIFDPQGVSLETYPWGEWTNGATEEEATEAGLVLVAFETRGDTVVDRRFFATRDGSPGQLHIEAVDSTSASGSLEAELWELHPDTEEVLGNTIEVSGTFRSAPYHELPAR